MTTAALKGTLLLLGFGSEANWWLEKFPDIPVLSEERNVNDEQALVISFMTLK